MDEFFRIPGNEEGINALTNCLESDEALAFVGAGASVPLYPTWNTLIQSLADEAFHKELASENDKKFWLELSEQKPQDAVGLIKDKIGVTRFNELLADAFSPKTGDDGRSYTGLQAAIMHLNICGIVTTNYDPGLLEARIHERPDIQETGYTTWKDRDSLHLWHTYEILSRDTLPVLYAHGQYQHSDSLILSIDTYEEAYKNGLYQRTFENLWSQRRLICIGYGFNDPFLDFIKKRVIKESTENVNTKPRHFVLLGISPNDYSEEIRKHYRSAYNAEPIFFPLQRIEDGIVSYDSLLRLLHSLSLKSLKDNSFDTKKHVDLPPPFQEIWHHETTNDKLFYGRSSDIKRLTHWAYDPKVKCIGITGMGGQGKTALIGEWLKNNRPSDLWRRKGVFFWSFYADPSVTNFLINLMELRQTDNSPIDFSDGSSLVKSCVKLLKETPLIIALDGLELLQEKPSVATYGSLLEDDLRDFLDSCAREKHKSIVILTSRFPFADLQRYVGRGLRLIELGRLTPNEGAVLLSNCGVKGSFSIRTKISRELDGHPLALRIFSAALTLTSDGDPSRVCEIIFLEDTLRDEDRFESKLKRLLSYYDSLLPIEQRYVLQIVSLFRTPEGDQIISRLVENKLLRDSSIEIDNESILNAIKTLSASGLLIKDFAENNEKFSCHPILRDHFRKSLIDADIDTATEAASILTNRPGEEAPTDVRQLYPILDAIELFLDTGYCERADELYVSRLNNGKHFLSIPAIPDGRRCALSFIGTESRFKSCETKISPRKLRVYITTAAKFANDAGEATEALDFYIKASAYCKNANDKHNHAIALRSKAITLTNLGRLIEAKETALEAVALVKRTTEYFTAATCLSDLAYICGLLGERSNALTFFDESDEFRDISKKRSRQKRAAESYGEWDIRLASIYILLDFKSLAEKCLRRSLENARRYNFTGDEARCNLVFGELAIDKNSFNSATTYLQNAEVIARRGNMLIDLARILICKAKLEIKMRDFKQAYTVLEEAVTIVEPRNLDLLLIELLVVRGRAILSQLIFQKIDFSEDDRILSALDDGDTALRLARSSNYAWAERDAEYLISDVYGALGDSDKSESHKYSAKFLSNQLKE